MCADNELPWCIPHPHHPLTISHTIPHPPCQPKSPRTRAKAVIDPGNEEQGDNLGERIPHLQLTKKMLSSYSFKSNNHNIVLICVNNFLYVSDNDNVCLISVICRAKRIRLSSVGTISTSQDDKYICSFIWHRQGVSYPMPQKLSYKTQVTE